MRFPGHFVRVAVFLVFFSGLCRGMGSGPHPNVPYALRPPISTGQEVQPSPPPDALRTLGVGCILIGLSFAFIRTLADRAKV